MLDRDLETRILAAVDEGFDAQVKLTQDLVRFPSLRGQEHTAQDFVADEIRRRGLDLERFKVEVEAIRHHPAFSPVTVSYENAWNVVGQHRPRETKGRSLILNGHIDVVPIGPTDMWTSPPFEPRIEDGWLYGRGSGDMKAGIAANFAALDALKRLGLQPAAPVYLQSVVEEECTGNGALACLVRGYRADAAIIPEPVEERLIRANVGVLWFQVQVRGRPVHVREAGSGANAIEAAYRLMQALKGLEARWNEPSRRHPEFADQPHPLNCNIGKIAGGDWASSVPAWCNFDVRMAIFPGTTAAEARREIEDCLRQAALADPYLSNHPPEVVWNGFYREGYVLARDGDAERCLADSHQRAVGAELGRTVSPAYLDASIMVLYGDTPTLVYGPRSDGVHGFDERVELASIKRITKAIALFVADWCGVESA